MAVAIVNLCVAVAGSALVLAITRRRAIAWDRDLGFVLPSWHLSLFWLAVWIAWLAFGEAVTRVFHLAQPEPWLYIEPAVFWMRVAALGIAGPFLEELVFRGVLLDRLRRTRLGVRGAILVTAVAWAVLHFRYGIGSVALIAADGVVLGLARTRGGSLWIPVALHMIGNLVSIYQSNP